MRRSIAIFLAMTSLVACNDRGPPAAAYQDWKDRLVVAAGLGPVFWPCTVKETEMGVVVYASIPVDKCYKMDPQRHWRGVWRDEFEGSRFCPEPARDCQFDTPGNVIWLDPERVSRKEPDGALYAVEFVGRRTSVPGRYGHMGGSDYELIVDRFISLKQIGPALPSTTEAQIEAEVQRCRRIKQCSSSNR